MHLARKLALTATLLNGSLALAQTAWPAAMADYTRGWPESRTPAVLSAPRPIVAPDPALDPHKKAFSGNWQGWACRSAACDVRVAVEQVTETSATLSYAGANDLQGVITDRAQAVFAGQELQAPLHTGARLALRPRTDGDLDFSLARDGKLISVGVLSQQAPAYRRTVERIPTPWTHEGAPLILEAVVYRPPGTGPWPTLVFNHGSTGNGDRPDIFKLTYAAPELGKYFVARGWQVVFPQRRGRGLSGGLYDEGFEPDRSRYACRPDIALAGMDRAVEDLDVVMAHLRGQPDVDTGRLLIGGVSRGGILSVTYAGLRPGQFQGVLNFVGGWVGDRCVAADQVNLVAFRRGATADKPMLWLYGDKDPFYSLKHSRANYKAFTEAGGQARFVAYQPAEGDIGHMLHPYPGIWRADVDAYLKELRLP